MKSPHINGHRDVIFCPVCRAFRVNRFKGCCGNCGVRIAYKGEFFGEDELYMDSKGFSYRAVPSGNGKYNLRLTTDDDIIFFINQLLA
jgi:hypothetical protein